MSRALASTGQSTSTGFCKGKLPQRSWRCCHPQPCPSRDRSMHPQQRPLPLPPYAVDSGQSMPEPLLDSASNFVNTISHFSLLSPRTLYHPPQNSLPHIRSSSTASLSIPEPRLSLAFLPIRLATSGCPVLSCFCTVDPRCLPAFPVGVLQLHTTQPGRPFAPFYLPNPQLCACIMFSELLPYYH